MGSLEEVGLLEEFEEKIENGCSGRGGGCLVETGVMVYFALRPGDFYASSEFGRASSERLKVSGLD